MKFETIKQKCIEELTAHKVFASGIKEKEIRLIEDWDVRCADTLLKRYPNVCKSLQGKRLTALYKDNGWHVEVLR